jgi:hypothetical protein
MRVDGVRDASFSFVDGTGWVTYDSEKTDPAAFIAELDSMTDFSAEVEEIGNQISSREESPE